MLPGICLGRLHNPVMTMPAQLGFSSRLVSLRSREAACAITCPCMHVQAVRPFNVTTKTPYVPAGTLVEAASFSIPSLTGLLPNTDYMFGVEIQTGRNTQWPVCKELGRADASGLLPSATVSATGTGMAFDVGPSRIFNILVYTKAHCTTNMMPMQTSEVVAKGSATIMVGLPASPAAAPEALFLPGTQILLHMLVRLGTLNTTRHPMPPTPSQNAHNACASMHPAPLVLQCKPVHVDKAVHDEAPHQLLVPNCCRSRHPSG